MRRSLIPLGGEVIVSEPKTARGRRSIALDPETVEVLKAQAARQLAEQQKWGEAWTDSGYICTKEDGTPYHPEVVSRYFRQAVKEAKLPTIRPARPAAHPRHLGPAGRHPPQGRLRAPRPRHRLDHAGHLLARHPGDAGGGGGVDRGSGVCVDLIRQRLRPAAPAPRQGHFSRPVPDALSRSMYHRSAAQTGERRSLQAITPVAIYPQLFYFPILYATYFYPRKGIILSANCGIVYECLVYLSLFPDLR